MEIKGIQFTSVEPIPVLADFVESIWMLKNEDNVEKEIILLPDGRFDIIFSYTPTGEFHATLKGLETTWGQAVIAAGIVMFVVSFKLLAIEYLLNFKVASALNEGQRLPDNFWGIKIDDLKDFEFFCHKITRIMQSLIKPNIDNRKKELFTLIYGSTGSLSVKELSQKVFWSSRQINRYFNQQFGIALKAYCTILRFKTALQPIKEGHFSGDEHFADQAHFIKEIKKFSGVLPKDLHKNQNGRFILFSSSEKK